MNMTIVLEPVIDNNNTHSNDNLFCIVHDNN